jgi:hypothetical protein
VILDDPVSSVQVRRTPNLGKVRARRNTDMQPAPNQPWDSERRKLFDAAPTTTAASRHQAPPWLPAPPANTPPPAPPHATQPAWSQHHHYASGGSNVSGISTLEGSLGAEQQHTLLLEQLRVHSERDSRQSSTSGHQPLPYAFAPPPPPLLPAALGVSAEAAALNGNPRSDVEAQRTAECGEEGTGDKNEGKGDVVEKRGRKCCGMERKTWVMVVFVGVMVPVGVMVIDKYAPDLPKQLPDASSPNPPRKRDEVAPASGTGPSESPELQRPEPAEPLAAEGLASEDEDRAALVLLCKTFVADACGPQAVPVCCTQPGDTVDKAAWHRLCGRRAASAAGAVCKFIRNHCGESPATLPDVCERYVPAAGAPAAATGSNTGAVAPSCATPHTVVIRICAGNNMSVAASFVCSNLRCHCDEHDHTW